MCVQPAPWPEPVPQIAAAIVAKYPGKRPRPLAVQVRDRLGQWLADEEFAAVFGIRGRPIPGCGGAGAVLLRRAKFRRDSDHISQVQHLALTRILIGAAGRRHGSVGGVSVRPQRADDHNRVGGIQQHPDHRTGQSVLAVQIVLKLIQPHHRPRGWRPGQRGDLIWSGWVQQPPVRQQSLHGFGRTTRFPYRGPADQQHEPATFGRGRHLSPRAPPI